MNTILKSIARAEHGRWVSPEEVAQMAWNGRGIKLKSMMNKIYSGKLNGFVEQDKFGTWRVFIPEPGISSPLKVA